MKSHSEIYKVCSVTNNGTLRSAAANGLEARLYGMNLEYPLNEEVHAKEGTVGIFCFPELARAVCFADRWHYGVGRVVVRCTTTHRPKQLPRVFGLHWASMWRTHANLLTATQPPDAFGTRVYAAPPGTCVVPSLTPREVMT